MTTPYGTTLFTHETNALQTNNFRFIQATDPLGGSERVERHWFNPAIAPRPRRTKLAGTPAIDADASAAVSEIDRLAGCLIANS